MLFYEIKCFIEFYDRFRIPMEQFLMINDVFLKLDLNNQFCFYEKRFLLLARLFYINENSNLNVLRSNISPLREEKLCAFINFSLAVASHSDDAKSALYLYSKITTVSVVVISTLPKVDNIEGTKCESRALNILQTKHSDQRFI